MKEDWKETTFGNFVDCNPKISIKKGQVIENCEMEDINPDYKFLYPREGKLYNGSNSKFQNGDTVFARITPCLENGKIAQIKDLKTEAAIGSTEFFVFRGKSQISDNEFIYYLSKSNLVRDTAVNSMTGASGRQRADLKALKKLEIKVPSSVKHQQRIASILSAYDDLIEVNNKRIELLEQSARELYKEWFVRMRFPNYQNTKFNKGIPEGWDEKKIEDIACFQYGYTASATTNNTGVRFLRITDIVSKQINWESVPFCVIDDFDLNKYSLNFGDIVVARTGATVGYAKRINKLHPQSVFASYLVKIQPYDLVLNYFLGIIIESNEYKEYIQATASGAAQPNANATILTSYSFYLPIKELILKFNHVVSPLFDQIENLQKQNQQLTEIRNRLLPRLMSGKLEVKA